MQRALSKVVEIRPGEGRLVLLLLVLSACMGIARSTITTASVAIFFDRYDASVLPMTYVGSAVLVSAAGALYARLEGKLSFATLLVATLAGIALYLGALRATLLLDADWPAFAVALSNEVVWVLSGLVYWGLAARLMDVRQSKRLFGFIGSGEVAAMVLGGLATPLIVGLLGNEGLVTMSAVAIGAGTLLLGQVLRENRARIAEGEESAEENEPPPPGQQSGSRWRDPYLWLVVGFSALCQITYYFVDTGYVTEVNAQLPTPEAMAGFLGVFWAVTYTITFLTRVLVVGPMLNRLGVGFQLLVTPIAIGIGVTSVALVGNLFGRVPALFWLVCLSKVLIEICWDSIYGPAKLIVLQPLPVRQRTWTQTIVEGVAEPVAQGAAGLILLLYAVFVPLNGVTLSNAALPLCVAFTVVGVLVGRRYLVALRAAVARRHAGDVTLSLTDQATLDALEHGLGSDSPAQVIYCIGKLADAAHPRLDALLLRLLEHPAPEVREDALGRIERLRIVDDVSSIERLLAVETAPRVRAAALRAICALAPAVAFERAGPALEDPEPVVRMGALEGLLRHGSGDSLRLAEEHLRALAATGEADARAFAAEAIGEVGFTRPDWPLTALLRDGSSHVRRAALSAAGKVAEPDYWPVVIENLHSIHTSGAATAALAAGGAVVVPFVEQALRRPETSLKTRLNALTACGRIGGDAAIALLERQVAGPSAEARHQALRALDAARYRPSASSVRSASNSGSDDAGAIARVHALIQKEAEIACWAIAAGADLEREALVPEHTIEALRIERSLAVERLFWLLSFIYDHEAIDRARANYASDTQDRRANAVELLDTVIGHEHKPLVLPLVEELETGERLRRLHARFPQTQLRTAERLVDIATRPEDWITPWTRACALHALALLDPARALDIARIEVASGDAIVAETAQWALAAPVSQASRTVPAMPSVPSVPSVTA